MVRLARCLILILVEVFLICSPGLKAQAKEDYQTYSGRYLKELRVPVGGLSTGNLLLGGRGNLQHFEIFNRPDRTRKLIKSFFSLWVEIDGKESVAKILERELIPPFRETTHQYIYGLPRMREVTFSNHYPVPQWLFQDEEIPLVIKLEVLNPFIPLDLDSSSYPIAAFYWNLENRTDERIRLSLALNLENPIQAEKIVNQYYEHNSVKGLRYAAVEGMQVNFDGGMVIGTTAENTLVQTHWYSGRWRDDSHIFWDDFSDDGRIQEIRETWLSTYQPVSYNEVSNRNGTVLTYLELEPGQKTQVPFYISWYFPKRTFSKNETFWIEEAAGKEFENYYSKNFNSETEVLHRFIENEERLIRPTRRFAALLQQSSVPSFVKEALTTQASTLKTNLIQITRDGKAHGFEGITDNGWCCPGTCTHVWNYEQTLASLFPRVERSMREIEFKQDTFDNGFQTHRSVFPLGDYWFDGPAAADGQMGSIIRVYREWKMSGDTDWLKSIWPKVKKAILFAWEGPGNVSEERLKYQERQSAWDPDREGILTGRQHNTYDISFFGPNSMTSSLYLAALKACSEMSDSLGDHELAGEFNRVYRKGVRSFEELLWNGDYFIQIITEDPESDIEEDYELSPSNQEGSSIPKYQYGNGCLADQLLGQYLAHISGLGYILDPPKVDRAMYQIYQNNFIEELRDFSNVQRVYALNDESGLILCSWPQGNRPAIPFVYSDEIWTGVEYQAAASMIFSNHVSEGLEIVKAVQDRHDGYKRNPFEQNESGVHYARAMSSWSILLALSGFRYDGVNHKLGFAPRINPESFNSFWSTGNAWGSLEMDDRQARLRVEFGQLELAEFSVHQPLDPFSEVEGGSIQGDRIIFREHLLLQQGDELQLRLKGWD